MFAHFWLRYVGMLGMFAMLFGLTRFFPEHGIGEGRLRSKRLLGGVFLAVVGFTIWFLGNSNIFWKHHN